MDKILSLEFSFKSRTYYALVRSQAKKGEKHHHITIMNGELERLLYGFHIIIEKEKGELHPVYKAPDIEIEQLQSCVLHSLRKKMKEIEPIKDYKNELQYINT